MECRIPDLSAEGLATREDLPERVAQFVELLNEEPCQKPEIIGGQEWPGCVVESSMMRMCPACRLSQFFYMTVVRIVPEP